MTAATVIIGACHAGVQIADWMRELGHEEPILLIGDEAEPPYQRPPLSKGLLLGEVAEDELQLRGEDFYRDNAIELVTSCRITAIDRVARVVSAADGRHFGYRRLALATGTRVRRLTLPGAELPGVVYVRSLTDARALRERLADCQAAVVIGGGFIGLEVAAVLARLGKPVTVIEAQERLMARAVGAVISDFYAGVHAGAGVDLRLGTGIAAITGSHGRVDGVTTDRGERIAADLVVVGIGVLPNQELAEAAGLLCDGGIRVDRFARTSAPDIVAAGDVTRHPCAFAGGTELRLESVQNALDQAKTAAATLVGEERPHDAVPWFWSDQYELKLQMVGLSAGHDRWVTRGDREAGCFSVFYFNRKRLVAVDSVNRPEDHLLGRKLLAKAVTPLPEQAADLDFDLRSLL